MKKKQLFQWTKKHLREMVESLDSKTSIEIADSIGTTRGNVNQMAVKMRKYGVRLARKRVNGLYDTLIKDFLKENPKYVK